MNINTSFSPAAILTPELMEKRLAAFSMRFTQPPLYHHVHVEDPKTQEEYPAASALAQEYSPYMHAPFLGNGVLGAMLWQDDHGLRFEINAADAYDHRENSIVTYGRNRVRNGYYHLTFRGKPTDQWNLQLSLWDAVLSGTIQTTKGCIRLQAFTHATQRVNVFRLTFDGGEGFDWSFHALPSDSTRPILWVQPGRLVADYPPAWQEQTANITYVFRRLTNRMDGKDNPCPEKEGRSVNAWQTLPQHDGSVLVLSTYTFRNVDPDGCGAKAEAMQALKAAAVLSYDELVDSHRQWWHDRLARSAVFLPDEKLESFYWVQMYKLLSAVRAEGPATDLFGPWFKPSGWNALWANLNIQMAYSPLPMAGHGDLCKSYVDWLDPAKLEACASATGIKGSMALPGVSTPFCIDEPLRKPKGLLECRTTVGNLPYSLVYAWEYYRCGTGDETWLRERFFPLLKGSLRYYQTYLYRGEDRKLHLPYTWSPEWGVNTEDTSFDLALIRWCCRMLLQLQEQLGLEDSIFRDARQVHDDLVDYPQDPTYGLYIGKDEPYHHSHRHWSHLFAIYPCGEMTYDDAKQKALIDASMKQYMSYQELYTGFSFVAIASLYAVCKNGEAAVKSLHKLLRAPYLWSNTMYTEMGDWAWPTFETPVSVNRSLQELLLSTGENIEVFPAVPGSWKDLGFFRLIATGGVAVSAAKKDGSVQWVCLESCNFQERLLQLPEGLDAIHCAQGVSWQAEGRGLKVRFPEDGGWLLAAASEDTQVCFGGEAPTECHWGSEKPKLH